MKSTYTTLAVALALIVAGMLLQYSLVDPSKLEELPVFGDVADFTLTDSEAQVFNSQGLKGKVWVINFFFTSCEGICPAVNGRMAALYRSFKDKSAVRVVSVSVDPERDTPERLAAYAQRFKADTKQWHFLTGPSGYVSDMMYESFKLGAADKPVNHTTRVVLVDREHRIRGYYHGLEQESFDQLERDLNRLVNSD